MSELLGWNAFMFYVNESKVIFVVVMLYGRAHGPAHTVEHLMVISDF